MTSYNFKIFEQQKRYFRSFMQLIFNRGVKCQNIKIKLMIWGKKITRKLRPVINKV